MAKSETDADPTRGARASRKEIGQVVFAKRLLAAIFSVPTSQIDKDFIERQTERLHQEWLEDANRQGKEIFSREDIHRASIALRKRLGIFEPEQNDIG